MGNKEKDIPGEGYVSKLYATYSPPIRRRRSKLPARLMPDKMAPIGSKGKDLLRGEISDWLRDRGITYETVLEELVSLAFGDIRDYIERKEDGRIGLREDLSGAVGAQYLEISNTRDGDRLRVGMPRKLEALQIIARYLNLPMAEQERSPIWQVENMQVVVMDARERVLSKLSRMHELLEEDSDGDRGKGSTE